MPTDSFKILWTKNVEQFEGSTAANRTRVAPNVHLVMLDLPLWTDAKRSLFSDSWDSLPNLRRRFKAAWDRALIEQGRGEAQRPDPGRYDFDGFGNEFANNAERLGNQVADVANSAGRALGNVVNGTEKTTKSAAFVPGVIILVLVLGAGIVAWKVA